MKKPLMCSILTLLIAFSASNLFAYPNYTGYSGSPGRQACSISCHHRHNFASTITLTGFPESYTPGQQYTIAVGQNGGSAISQFNCSARIGTGSSNAGVISAGTYTTTYNTGGETNGVHFSSTNRNSGTFVWTAPASGAGDVRLYWAGLQGSLSSGADTQIVLVSSENSTGIGSDTPLPKDISLEQNYPNPFNSETKIDFSVTQPGPIELQISNILGQSVYSRKMTLNQPGNSSVLWDGKDNKGIDLPSGVYFYRLQTSDASLTRRMILLR